MNEKEKRNVEKNRVKKNCTSINCKRVQQKQCHWAKKKWNQFLLEWCRKWEGEYEKKNEQAKSTSTTLPLLWLGDFMMAGKSYKVKGLLCSSSHKKYDK